MSSEAVILNNFLISLEQDSHIFDGRLTVEEYINLKTALASAIKALGEQRPQGEWGKDVRLINYLTRKCLECGKNSAVGNFCVWCGADMRPRILDEAVDGEGKDGKVKEGDEK